MTPVVPIAEITRRAQSLACWRFGCVLSAGACVARHTARAAQNGMLSSRPTAPPYPTCARCPDGAAIARQVAGDKTPWPPPRAAVATARRRAGGAR